MMFAIVYTVVLLILAIITFIFSFQGFRKKKILGKLLGVISIIIVISSGSYLASVLSKNHTVVNVFANIYFGTISIILALYAVINTLFCRFKFNKFYKSFFIIVGTYATVEFCLFIVNIFVPFDIEFVPSTYENIAPYFIYKMHIPYYFHLAYSYLMILFVFVQLIVVTTRTPGAYKKSYIYVIVGLALIILVNAIFLFVPSSNVISRFDMSLPGYYILLLMIFYFEFYYKKNGMVPVFKGFIVDNSSEGYVLFDYQDRLVLTNDNAKRMLLNIKLDDELTNDEFLQLLDFELPSRKTANQITMFQLTLNKGNESKTLRCTFRTIVSKRNEVLGCIYSFADAELENDILTGFQSYNSFLKLVKSERNFFTDDLTFTMIDIDELGLINSTRSYNYGDQLIQQLSQLMKKYFPKNSYFIRCEEAALGVFTIDLSEDNIIDICNSIKKEFPYSFQFAFGEINSEDNLLEKIRIVENSLNTKKILDSKSKRSNNLKALLSTLQEVDKDTLAHVERTKVLAEKLGKRLGLNSIERTRLSLLSMLHDIGKITIPLEILNKPSSLNEDEWEVLKTHTIKGKNIALSSPLFKDIADEILHHHERWDGMGYPDGLSKETIPLLSRIVSVVDSFDAMISDRPYRKRMSVNEAIEELKRNSGTQFDPRVVSEFIPLVEDKTSKKVKGEINITEKFIANNKSNKSYSNYVNTSILFSKYIIDDGVVITTVDDNFTKLTGYTKEDVKNGLKQLDLIPDEDKVYYAEQVAQLMTVNQFCFIEHRIKKKDGTIINVFCYGSKYYDSAKKMYRDEILVFNIDGSFFIKDIIKKEEDKSNIRLKSWEKVYRTDSLTNLLSHNAFKNDASLALLNNSKGHIFIMIDIDSFKEFNDTYGHKLGDEFLVYLANIIIENLTDKEYLASRLGGDEFALLISYDKNIEVNKIKQKITDVFSLINNLIKEKYGMEAGISMGVTFKTEKINSFDELYDKADTAMYERKRNGKDGVAFFN